MTAREVAATGLDWTFAPTVAVPQDDRWGRTYEGLFRRSRHRLSLCWRDGAWPARSATDLRGQRHVISNVKHFVGTAVPGADRGQKFYSEEDLRNPHAVGYFGAGCRCPVVMASFNSWHNELNRDVLPEDGLSTTASCTVAAIC